MVNVKIGFKEEHIYKVTPEFEDAKEIALKNDIPLRKVYSEVNHKAKQLLKEKSLL
jgi:pyridinium-3,5-bisthiocarboxylic acid mononucleotide nickel chelatase